MDLQQLSYFRTVARLQHMTRAAEELGLAQPSLSRAVRALEAELGVRLFDRVGRNIRLNAPGRAFLRRVEGVFQSIEDGKREVESLAGMRREEIGLAAVSFHWATGLLRAFSAEHPEVRFRLFQRTLPEMLRNLRRREVELCFMVRPRWDEEVEWRLVASSGLFVLLPPGHRLTGRRTVGVDELASEPMILPRPGDGLREAVDACYARAGLVADVVCESDETLSVHGLVDAGLGLTIVPDLGRTVEIGSEPRRVRLSDPACGLEMGIAWVSDSHQSQPAAQFVDFLLDRFPNVADA